MRSLRILEVKSEIGAGTRGASLGIDAMKVAALNAGSMLFSELPRQEVPPLNDALYASDDTPQAKHIEFVQQMYERVCSAVAQTVESGECPLVLAGDHSTAGATIAGLRTAYPERRLGVIWIDAHADLHSPYTTPSGNMHGMPLALALGDDNLDHQRNVPAEKTVRLWEKMKQTFPGSPWILPEDLVFIALRDVEPEEVHLLQKYQIASYPVQRLRAHGVPTIAREILAHLRQCDLIYLSFDVDSLDCNLVSRGTGTPVPDGLTEQEAANLLKELCSSGKIACLEIVEVNPTLDDKGNKMAETAFRLLKQVVQVMQSEPAKIAG